MHYHTDRVTVRVEVFHVAAISLFAAVDPASKDLFTALKQR